MRTVKTKASNKTGYSPGWSGEKEPTWQDQAACKGSPGLFDVLDKTSYPNLSMLAFKGLNNKNFAEAKKICASCPVLESCLSSAEPEDFEYTFRAGRYPVGYTTRSLGRPQKNSKDLSERVCKEGHKGNFRPRPDGRSPECRTCHNAREREKRKTNSTFTAKPTQSRGVLCKWGHDNWRTIFRPVRGRTEYYCVTCKQDRNAAAWRDKRDAKLEG